MKLSIALILFALLSATSASAESELKFTLLLGGDNHYQSWENQVSSNNWAYTGGNPADGQLFRVLPRVLHWAVTAELNGAPDDCVTLNGCRGLARVAFDLELHHDTADGPLVTEIGAGGPNSCGWFSTINDGDNDGLAGAQRGPDPFAPAAFAVAFNAHRDDPPVDTTKRGRLIDTVPADGPWMQDYAYPVAGAGTLTGMFAGYTHYTASRCPGFFCIFANATQNAGGVGNVIDSIGLGFGPIAEGQINFDCLPSGTYVLKLIARRDENLLLGDFDPTTDSPVEFTHPVETIAGSTDGGATGGDTITFTYRDPWLTDAFLTSAVSRKVHPGNVPVVGDVDLVVNGYARVEPRLGGPTEITLRYDNGIEASDGGDLDCDNVLLTAGTCDHVTGGGTPDIGVHLRDVPDPSCVSLELTGVRSVTHGDVAPAQVRVKAVAGDVNGDSVVNIVDLTDVKDHLFQGGGGSTPLVDFLDDVNVDGVINIVDLNTVKTNLFHYVRACP